MNESSSPVYGIEDISRIPGKIHCAFIILCFLGSQYLFYTLLNCYLGWISEDGRKKKSRFSHFFIWCVFSSHPIQTPGLRTYFPGGFSVWKEECYLQWEVGSMGKGCLEEKIPVMSSGQAPVSHQGLWTAQEFLAKASPSCPISQANIWEPHGPRKYLFPKSVNDRLQRGWWNVNLLGCFSELSRKHRHEEPAEMESSADELCSSGGKQMNK